MNEEMFVAVVAKVLTMAPPETELANELLERPATEYPTAELEQILLSAIEPAKEFIVWPDYWALTSLAEVLAENIHEVAGYENPDDDEVAGLEAMEILEVMILLIKG